MVPFPIPSVITAALGMLGAAAFARTLAREWRRINEELDSAERAAATVEAVDGERLPKLRRDPRTGIYRPE
ncbi:MAG: hypothetical protein R3D62_15915 [Xanthobacteraceae bacterium]